MMAECIANGCCNKPSKDLEFFNFPENEDQRDKWIAALQKPDGWIPSAESKICSVHFVMRQVSPHPWHPDYVPSVFRRLRTKKRDKSSRARQIIEAELGLDDRSSEGYGEVRKYKKPASNRAVEDGLGTTSSTPIGEKFVLKRKKPIEMSFLGDTKKKSKQLIDSSDIEFIEEDLESVQSVAFDSYDDNDSLLLEGTTEHVRVGDARPKKGTAPRGRPKKAIKRITSLALPKSLPNEPYLTSDGAPLLALGEDAVKCDNCQSYIQEIAALNEELLAKRAIVAEWDTMIEDKCKLYQTEVDLYKNELKTLQSKISGLQMTEDFFKKKKHRVMMYTGLPNYSMLITVFNLVQGAVRKDKHIYKISPFQKFILCLMRLRMNLKFKDLAYRFNVDLAKIERFFPEWIDALHQQLSHVLLWPHDNVDFRLNSYSAALKEHYKAVKNTVPVTKFISREGLVRKNHKIETVCASLLHISQVALSDVQDKLPDVLANKEEITVSYLKFIGKYVPPPPLPETGGVSMHAEVSASDDNLTDKVKSPSTEENLPTNGNESNALPTTTNQSGSNTKLCAIENSAQTTTSTTIITTTSSEVGESSIKDSADEPMDTDNKLNESDIIPLPIQDPLALDNECTTVVSPAKKPDTLDVSANDSTILGWVTTDNSVLKKLEMAERAKHANSDAAVIANTQKGSDALPSSNPEKNSDASSSADPEKSSDASPLADSEKDSDVIATADSEKGSDSTTTADQEKGSDATTTANQEKGSDATTTADQDKGSDAIATADPEKERDTIATVDPKKGSDTTASTDLEKGSDLTATADPEKGNDATATADPEKGSDATATTDPEKGSGATTTADPENGNDATTTADPEKVSDATVTAKADKGIDASATADPEKGSGATATADPEISSDASCTFNAEKGSKSSTSADPEKERDSSSTAADSAKCALTQSATATSDSLSISCLNYLDSMSSTIIKNSSETSVKIPVTGSGGDIADSSEEKVGPDTIEKMIEDRLPSSVSCLTESFDQQNNYSTTVSSSPLLTNFVSPSSQPTTSIVSTTSVEPMEINSLLETSLAHSTITSVPDVSAVAVGQSTIAEGILERRAVCSSDTINVISSSMLTHPLHDVPASSISPMDISVSSFLNTLTATVPSSISSGALSSSQVLPAGLAMASCSASVAATSDLSSNVASSMTQDDLVFNATDVPSVAADILSELMGTANNPVDAANSAAVADELLSVANALAANAGHVASDVMPLHEAAGDGTMRDVTADSMDTGTSSLALHSEDQGSADQALSASSLEKLHLGCQSVHEELIDHVELLAGQLVYNTKLMSFDQFQELVRLGAAEADVTLTVAKDVPLALQCWITLTKLKLNLDDQDLAFSYNISVGNVRSIFSDWVNIFSSQVTSENRSDSWLDDELLMKQFAYLRSETDKSVKPILDVCRFIDLKSKQKAIPASSMDVVYSCSFSDVWGSVGPQQSASQLQERLNNELQELQGVLQQRPQLSEELLQHSSDDFVRYYTGFADYDSLHDMCMALLPGPELPTSKRGELSPFSQLMCVLLRLVNNFTNEEVLLRIIRPADADDAMELLCGDNPQPDIDSLLTAWLPWIHSRLLLFVTWPECHDEGRQFVQELRQQYAYLRSVAPHLRLQAEAVCTALHNAGHHLYCITSEEEEDWADQDELVDWLF